MREPRYYQRDAKNSLILGSDFHSRQLVKMPTGSGKTFMVADAIGELQPQRCLYLADQDELVTQPRREIQKVTGIIAAVEQGKERADLRAGLVVASSASLARESKHGSGEFPRLERYPKDHFQWIFSDEAHRGTERDKRVWDYFENARVIGLTATPFRENMADLSKYFSRIAMNMDIMDLVEEGFAPPPRRLVLPVEINIEAILTKRGMDGKEFDLDSVDSTIAPYYDIIADLIVEHARGRFGIAYLPLRRSSEAFASILRSKGIRAYHIDGNSKDRDALIERFSDPDGDIDWLCNANLLSTGVDIPKANCFLNLRLTHSRAWFQQARGRVMRVLPGVVDHLPEKEQAAERRALIAASAKPDCLLLDLLLQNDKLGAVHVADDFCKNEHDAKTLFERSKTDRSPQDIAALAKAIQAEREAALVDALERAAIRSSMGSPITGDQVAALLNMPEFIGYVPIERWEIEPPSEKQLETLRHNGVDASSIKSKGQASAIMDLMFSRIKLGFSSVKQVKMIRQLNEFLPEHDRVHNPEQLSMDGASSVIDRMLKDRRRPTL